MRFAVIQRIADGKFLSLDDDGQCTREDFVENPIDAHRINKFCPDEQLKPPSYYLENSERARRWAMGCRSVWVEVVCEITVTP